MNLTLASQDACTREIYSTFHELGSLIERRRWIIIMAFGARLRIGRTRYGQTETSDDRLTTAWRSLGFASKKKKKSSTTASSVSGSGDKGSCSAAINAAFWMRGIKKRTEKQKTDETEYMFQQLLHIGVHRRRRQQCSWVQEMIWTIRWARGVLPIMMPPQIESGRAGTGATTWTLERGLHFANIVICKRSLFWRAAARGGGINRNSCSRFFFEKLQ
jgi:hypothetical protein